MVTLEAAVKDSGAIDVTLEEGEGDDDGAVEMKDNNHQSVKYSNDKCDQGTQTEYLSTFTVDDVALNQPVD